MRGGVGRGGGEWQADQLATVPWIMGDFAKPIPPMREGKNKSRKERPERCISGMGERLGSAFRRAGLESTTPNKTQPGPENKKLPTREKRNVEGKEDKDYGKKTFPARNLIT